jgi:hypothetical protein
VPMAMGRVRKRTSVVLAGAVGRVDGMGWKELMR